MTFKIKKERIHANGLDFHVKTCGEGDRLALLVGSHTPQKLGTH